MKFRHSVVRNMLVDICCNAVNSVHKEAPMGFLLVPQRLRKIFERFTYFCLIGFMTKMFI